MLLGPDHWFSASVTFLSPTPLGFLQKYTEEVLSPGDPLQLSEPTLQHLLEQPVERIQQYQALLKVGGTPPRGPSPWPLPVAPPHGAWAVSLGCAMTCSSPRS